MVKYATDAIDEYILKVRGNVLVYWSVMLNYETASDRTVKRDDPTLSTLHKKN